MGKEQEQDLVSSYLQEWAKNQDDVFTYIDYSHTEDFKRLWMDTKLEGAEKDSPQRFLLDWNGFPVPTPAFPKIVEFITPLDWALAVAYQLVEKNSSGAELPQIIIVDRYSYRYPGSFAVEMRRALVEALDGSVELYSAFGRDSEDLVALFDRLRSNSERRPAAPRQGQLRALRQAWIGYTVQSRDHHDINNLIGPLALAKVGENRANSSGDQSERALFCMARWLDLVEFGTVVDDDGWALDTRLAHLATTEEPISAVLVDDQASRWGHFLKNSFLGGNIDVSEISDPMKVLECLSPQLANQMPFKRCLTFDGSNAENGSDQVFFLDLRFFPDGNTAEREFIKKVCDKILELEFACSWPDDTHFRVGPLSARDQSLLFSDEFKPAHLFLGVEDKALTFVSAVRKILESNQIPWSTITSSRIYDELLTLFPRFLAQVFFTTPIVIFSSTGRRDLTEKFKGYGNIITGFEKPRLPVLHYQVVRSFKKAIDDAAQLVQARRLLRNLSAGPSKVGLLNPAKHYHVELFIDEHHPDHPPDLRNVWVGGFYAIFEGTDQEEAMQKAGRFDDQLVENGFSYYSRSPYLPNLPSGMSVKKKGDSDVSQLKITLSGNARPFCQGVVRLKCNARSKNNANAASGDDVFRQTLSTLVETFLDEGMARYFDGVPTTNVSVSILSGTRVTTRKGRKKTEARKIAYRSGLAAEDDWSGKEVLLDSVERSTIFSILYNLKQFRAEKWLIVRSVAVRMIYDYDSRGKVACSTEGYAVCRVCQTVHKLFMKADRTPGNQKIVMKADSLLCPDCGNGAHIRPDYPGGLYIADEVVSEASDKSNYWSIIGSGPIDFDDVLDNSLLRLVQSGRAADTQDRVTAALEASIAWAVAGPDWHTPLRRTILHRLSPIFAKLTGEEFHRFAVNIDHVVHQRPTNSVKVLLSGF